MKKLKRYQKKEIKKPYAKLRAVRGQLRDIKDKEYEKKQERLSRIRDPD